MDNSSQIHYEPFVDEGELPWQEQVFIDLNQLVQTGRLPHALLISGAHHIGKMQLARRWAWTLFCEQSEVAFCGQCKTCHLLKAGTHPDFLCVSPESGKDIRIDTIREITAKLNQTSQQGSKKICLISPAEAMNENAANALLKILEEPPANTFFILVTHSQQRLLPTIISRCHQLSLPIPHSETVKTWLADSSPRAKGLNQDEIDRVLLQARGFPLRALQLLEDGSAEKNFVDLLLEFLENKTAAATLVAKVDRSEYTVFLDECLTILHSAQMRMLLGEDAASQPLPGGDNQRALELKFATLGDKLLSELVADILRIKGLSGSNINLGMYIESFLSRCHELERQAG